MGKVSVVGIDASFTGFAVCSLDWDSDTGITDAPVFHRWGTKPEKTLAGRIDRIESLVYRAEREVLSKERNLILIEGYAFSARGNSGISLGELGGVLRYRLSKIHIKLAEVPPTVLKKFATGKGNANKAQVVSALSKCYGMEFSSDDEADAFGLASLGLAVMGRISSLTKGQKECMDTVKALI